MNPELNHPKVGITSSRTGINFQEVKLDSRRNDTDLAIDFMVTSDN